MSKRKKERKYPRERRYFSEAFRQARVKEIETGQSSVSEISRAYQVSRSAVYKWIRKYSVHYRKAIVQVVEPKSETKKRLALEEKLAQLEQMIGQQQVRIQYYEKLLELLEAHYEIDIEKNFDGKFLTGSSPTDPNTA